MLLKILRNRINLSRDADFGPNFLLIARMHRHIPTDDDDINGQIFAKITTVQQ